MKHLEHIYFDSRASFRNWLEKNHEKSAGIWMIFNKKHTNSKCIEYREALEEALCFGWIDSIIKKIDDDRYVRKFTPRTNTHNWSDLNKKIALSLIENGKMTEAGLAKIGSSLEEGKVDHEVKNRKEKNSETGFQIPVFIIKAFSQNEPALTNFKNLAPSHKRNYVMWITSAKREDTIRKRLNESIEQLKRREKLGLK
ncbi:MAG: YdeI/OmpD-associated family protein [Bacteroidales bacterium]|nr:YdeI/OmpD-associated family protein [Bacteroidales bacterium]